MPKRILKGKVVKNKSEKTIIVDVESTYMHKKYKKFLRKNKKYAVHDEENVSKIKQFELCNYDFMSLTDTALKKKLGLI